MRFRWTIKELNEITDTRLLVALVNERLSELNRYTPLARRLQDVREKLEIQAAKETKAKVMGLIGE